MKAEYKHDKRKNAILKDGHTMFLQDAVKDLNRKSYLETQYDVFLGHARQNAALSDKVKVLEEGIKYYSDVLRPRCRIKEHDGGKRARELLMERCECGLPCVIEINFTEEKMTPPRKDEDKFRRKDMCPCREQSPSWIKKEPQ